MSRGRELAAPPVIGGHPAHHSGTGNHPVRRVVIHSAVVPCERGRARQLGEWNRSGTTGGSWHYAVDPAETFQTSWDSYVCWHAPPNDHSLGIEMADVPGRRLAIVRLRQLIPWRWVGTNHKLLLARTARLTAELLVAEGLPAQFLNVGRLRRGERGWTTHHKVSRAWHQSSHWDPGWWPRRRFGRMVAREVREIRGDA